MTNIKKYFSQLCAVFIFIVLYFGVASVFSVIWILQNFGDVKLEQILLNLAQPIEGVAIGFVISGVSIIGIMGLVLTVGVYMLVQAVFKKYAKVVCLMIGLGCLAYPIIKWNLVDFIVAKYTVGTIYEEEHVVPKITTNQRNLIVIILESYEKTYQDESVFGKNLSPHLTQIQNENLSADGFYQLRQTHWTITSLLSSFCGVPLKLNNIFVDLSVYRTFIPGLSCWPNQLKEQGYETVLMKAASIQYTATDRFALQHGFKKAIGYRELKDEYGYVSNARWGLNDHQFYRAVKKELTALSQKGKPFLLATVQVDTHNPSGHLNETCRPEYHDFRDAISCSDKEAAALIRWIQAQPFYPNTTIIVMGDHIAPRADIDDILQEIPDRGIYFTIINPQTEQKLQPHTFTNVDVAPTILDAVGFNFDGKFGLGRSLFRSEPTLIETKGDELEFELDCFSKKYRSWGNVVPPSVFEDPSVLDAVPLGQQINLTNALSRYIGIQDMAEAVLGEIWLDENHGEMKFRINAQANKAYELVLRMYVPVIQTKEKEVRISIGASDTFTKKYTKSMFDTVRMPLRPHQIQSGGIVHLRVDTHALPIGERLYEGIRLVDMQINERPNAVK